jgi:hypothetical protein
VYIIYGCSKKVEGKADLTPDASWYQIDNKLKDKNCEGQTVIDKTLHSPRNTANASMSAQRPKPDCSDEMARRKTTHIDKLPSEN